MIERLIEAYRNNDLRQSADTFLVFVERYIEATQAWIPNAARVSTMLASPALPPPTSVRKQ